MKKLKFLALVVSISAFSFAQSINVTFQVDMSIQIFVGNFPPGANVVVRGSFQSDCGDPGGNWQGNLYQLSDPDSDDVYTCTFSAPVALAGNSYIFKYVIVNPPASDNWESTPDRQFTLTAPTTVIPVVWFNDDVIYVPPFEVANTIKFSADISSILGVGIEGAFDPDQDSLLVMGLDWNNYGKNIIGNRKMENTDLNPGIYTTTLTVTSGSAAPNGVGDSTNWKYRAFDVSRFQNTGWETGPDRWHVYQADGATVILPLIVPSILPSWNPPSLILTINLDMTGAINRYNGLPIPLSEIEFIGLKSTVPTFGNMLEGCWCSGDTLNGNMVLLTKISESNWRFERLVPMGINQGYYDYKFAVMYSGADTINGGIEPLNNEFADTLVHNVLLVDGPPIVINNLFGDPNPVGVERIENLLPSEYHLEQNYPNPFNPTTKIRYSIPEYSFVTLKVFNLLGEEIETLVNGEQSAGAYEATFDATNLSSGIYFYSLQTKDYSSTKKMILIR